MIKRRPADVNVDLTLRFHGSGESSNGNFPGGDGGEDSEMRAARSRDNVVIHQQRRGVGGGVGVGVVSGAG